LLSVNSGWDAGQDMMQKIAGVSICDNKQHSRGSGLGISYWRGYLAKPPCTASIA
jgi:hypothetical protein